MIRSEVPMVSIEPKRKLNRSTLKPPARLMKMRPVLNPTASINRYSGVTLGETVAAHITYGENTEDGYDQCGEEWIYPQEEADGDPTEADMGYAIAYHRLLSEYDEQPH